MKASFLILSLACLSCLLPPALGTSLLAARLAAVGAAKGAAVAAGVGGFAAKAAVAGVHAILGLKHAVVEGALRGLAEGSVPNVHYAVEPVVYLRDSIPPMPPQFPALLEERLRALRVGLRESFRKEAEAAGDLITAAIAAQFKPLLKARRVVSYELDYFPLQVEALPIMEVDDCIY